MKQTQIIKRKQYAFHKDGGYCPPGYSLYPSFCHVRIPDAFPYVRLICKTCGGTGFYSPNTDWHYQPTVCHECNSVGYLPRIYRSRKASLSRRPIRLSSPCSHCHGTGVEAGYYRNPGAAGGVCTYQIACIKCNGTGRRTFYWHKGAKHD